MFLSPLFKRLKQLSFAWVYLPLALVFGSIMVFAMPPFQVMDEYHHFQKAYWVSEGNLLCTENEEGKPGAYVPEEIFTLGHRMGLTDVNYNYAEKVYGDKLAGGAIQADGELVFAEAPFCESPVWATFPQAIGMSIGKLFGADALSLLYAGRYANMLTAVLIIFFALQLLPFYRALFGFVALLPMFMQQVSSLSLDALHYAGVFLFLALLLHFVYVKKSYSNKDLVLLLLVAFFGVYAKIGYMPLALLFMLLPKEKFKNTTHYWWYVVGSILVLLGSFFLLRGIFSVGDYVDAGSVNRGEQLMGVLQNPWHFGEVLVRSINNHLDYYWKNILGVLGWGDYELFGVHYVLLLLGGYTLLIGKSEEAKIPAWHRWVYLGVFLANTALLFLVLYALDDPVGWYEVSFMQTKYLLPLLPVGLLAIVGLRISVEAKKWVVAAVAVASIVLTLAAMQYRYYDYYSTSVLSSGAEMELIQVSADEPARQLVQAEADGLSGVMVWIPRWEHGTESPVSMILRDENCQTIVRNELTDQGRLANGGYEVFDFAPLDDSEGKTYCVQIFPLFTKANTPMQVEVSKEDSYEGGTLRVGDDAYTGDLHMKLIYKHSEL